MLSLMYPSSKVTSVNKELCQCVITNVAPGEMQRWRSQRRGYKVMSPRDLLTEKFQYWEMPDCPTGIEREGERQVLLWDLGSLMERLEGDF